MTNYKYPTKPMALAIAMAGSLITTAANAADFALEEIVVTAQKREQSLQEVPVAVTAFSSAELEAAGVQTIVELQKSSPNTTLQVSRGTNSTLTAYIRGVGQQDPLWGFEPGVGLYVDDVYLARPQGGVLDVYDVERVEILRGPQGSLYGKNTIGGAVKYVTRRLGDEAAFTVDASVGSYNQKDLKLSGSLPISDSVRLGVGLASLNRDGYGEFLISGDENYNKDLFSGRVSLEFTPSDSLFIRVAYDHTQDDSNAKGGHRMTPSVYVPGELTPSDPYDTYADMSTKNSVESSGASLTIEYDINESTTLKSITAYREGKTDTNIDFDNTSFASAHVPALYEDDQTTQEFQLNYEGEGWNLVSGLYYYSGTAAGAFDVLLGGFDGYFGTTLGFGPGNFTATSAGSVDTVSYAAYANANFSLTDSLSLTVGGRYNVDQKDAEVLKYQAMVDGRSDETGGETLNDIAILTDYSNDNSWAKFTPSASLDYIFTEDVMGYFSASQGFKSGGFDMRGDAAKNPNTVEGFDPESVITYELGLKTQLLDDRLRLNMAAFHSDYTDMQVTVQESSDGGTNYVASVLNAGKSKINGFELEAVAQLTEGLSAVFNVGLTKADFTSVKTQTPSGIVDLADVWEFSNTPEKTAFFKLNYDHDMAAMGSITLWTSLAYRDSVRMFEAAESVVDQKAYSLWDASAVWFSADDHWSVGLHGKNLTNEEFRVAGYNFANLGGESVVVGYYGDPRTVSLNAKYRF